MVTKMVRSHCVTPRVFVVREWDETAQWFRACLIEQVHMDSRSKGLFAFLGTVAVELGEMIQKNRQK